MAAVCFWWIARTGPMPSSASPTASGTANNYYTQVDNTINNDNSTVIGPTTNDNSTVFNGGDTINNNIVNVEDNSVWFPVGIIDNSVWYPNSSWLYYDDSTHMETQPIRGLRSVWKL